MNMIESILIDRKIISNNNRRVCITRCVDVNETREIGVRATIKGSLSQ